MTKNKSKAIEGQDQMKVDIRRQWNDWRIAEVNFTKLLNIAWDRYSGSTTANFDNTLSIRSHFLHNR
jgi:hypothetical protein